jgi:hypothetical protein
LVRVQLGSLPAEVPAVVTRKQRSLPTDGAANCRTISPTE